MQGSVFSIARCNSVWKQDKANSSGARRYPLADFKKADPIHLLLLANLVVKVMQILLWLS